MKTLLIDCDYPIEDAVKIAFNSPISCFDYDIVMWGIKGTFEKYKYQSAKYQGLPSLSDENSMELVQAMVRRREEFSEILSMGRSVIIFPTAETNVYCPTGETSTSGTGRNAKVTRMVSMVSLYDALPFSLKTTSASGQEVQAVDSDFAILWRQTQGYWIYRSILDKFPGKKVAQISNTAKVVGSIERYPQGGILAILPEPYWEDEGFEDEEELEESSDWGAGEHVSAPELLHSWVIEQMKGEVESAPEWLASYSFPEEDSLTAQGTALQEQLSQLLTQVDEVKAKQAEESRWKRLLSAQGGVLEAEVERALEVLGFTMLAKTVGRADIRAEAQEGRIVAEVKGLAKSAAEKNAAQLEKWVAEEAIAGDSAWKPLLIVNAWRGSDLDQRTQPAFPDQMLDYSTKRGHCLLTTSQLLAMVRTAMSDSTKGGQIRSQLLSTVGQIPGWELTEMVIRKTDTDSKITD